MAKHPALLSLEEWGGGTSLHLAAGGSSQPRRAQHSWLGTVRARAAQTAGRGILLPLRLPGPVLAFIICCLGSRSLGQGVLGGETQAFTGFPSPHL